MDRYQQSYEEALEINSENEEKWRKYKKELVDTSGNLKEFVRSHSLEIMVPIGKKAFLRGKLQHTNEVTVCHGASLFSDVSSSQAIEILEHRIKLCDERLSALDVEKDLFTHKLELPEDVFQPIEGQEIIEEYNDDEEAAWRRKHIENVRKLKQREAVERHRQIGNGDVNKLFDDYELVEELADELEQLEVDDDEMLSKFISGELKMPESKKRIAHNQVEQMSETTMPVESSLTSPIKHFPEINNNNNDLIAQNNQEIVDLLRTYRCKIKEVLRNVKKDDERNINLFLDLIELKDDIEDDIRKMNDDEEYSDSDERDSDDETTASIEVKPDDNKRKVRFSASLEDVKLIESKSEMYENARSSENNNTIHIQFTHSDAKFTSETSDDTIAHPGDIYKRFHSQPSEPPVARKSILKNKTPEKKPQEAAEEKPMKKIFNSDIQIIGDVVEHIKERHQDDDVVHIAGKGDVTKKVSKFKQMRLKS